MATQATTSTATDPVPGTTKTPPILYDLAFILPAAFSAAADAAAGEEKEQDAEHEERDDDYSSSVEDVHVVDEVIKAQIEQTLAKLEQQRASTNPSVEEDEKEEAEAETETETETSTDELPRKDDENPTDQETLVEEQQAVKDENPLPEKVVALPVVAKKAIEEANEETPKEEGKLTKEKQQEEPFVKDDVPSKEEAIASEVAKEATEVEGNEELLVKEVETPEEERSFVDFLLLPCYGVKSEQTSKPIVVVEEQKQKEDASTELPHKEEEKQANEEEQTEVKRPEEQTVKEEEPATEEVFAPAVAKEATELGAKDKEVIVNNKVETPVEEDDEETFLEFLRIPCYGSNSQQTNKAVVEVKEEMKEAETSSTEQYPHKDEETPMETQELTEEKRPNKQATTVEEEPATATEELVTPVIAAETPEEASFELDAKDDSLVKEAETTGSIVLPHEDEGRPTEAEKLTGDEGSEEQTSVTDEEERLAEEELQLASILIVANKDTTELEAIELEAKEELLERVSYVLQEDKTVGTVGEGFLVLLLVCLGDTDAW